MNISETKEPKSVWLYNQNFTRIQIRNGNNQTTIYDVAEILGKGKFGEVKALKSREGGRLKAVKYSHANLKTEYEMSLKWPNKSIGLSLHPKAYFPSTDSGIPEIIVMHKYDGKLTDYYHKMNSKQYLEMICQITHGIATLHGLNIFHHDLYFDNICYDTRLNRYDIVDFGIAIEDNVNYVKMGVSESHNLIQLIDKILFQSNNATLLSLDAKNLFAQIMGESKITLCEYELIRYNVLLEQGYSSEFARQILDFLTNPPTNAKAICIFFNLIQTTSNQSKHSDTH
jgi:serine/threonine protein kinase